MKYEIRCLRLVSLISIENASNFLVSSWKPRIIRDKSRSLFPSFVFFRFRVAIKYDSLVRCDGEAIRLISILRVLQCQPTYLALSLLMLEAPRLSDTALLNRNGSGMALPIQIFRIHIIFGLSHERTVIEILKCEWKRLRYVARQNSLRIECKSYQWPKY